MASQPAYLPALTSLRFLAALAVIAHHTVGFAPGYGGVSLFFVLSGFVMARSYGDRVSSDAQRSAFWIGRARRIFPLHLATLALALPLGVPSLSAALANVALLQSWVPNADVYFGLNAVSWSLSVEAFFYCCFPFVAHANWRHAVALIGIVMLAASTLAGHWTFYINPLARLPEFVAGIALANGKVPRTAGAQVGALWAITLCVVGAFPNTPLTEGIVFIPAAVLTIAYAADRPAEWLGTPGLVMAGEASFTLYMIAQLLQRYASAAFGASVDIAALSGVAAVAVAWMWYHRPRIEGRTKLRHSPAP